MTFQDKQISEPQFLLCKLKVTPALSTQQGLTYQLHFVPEEISLKSKTLGLLVPSERRSRYNHDSLCEVKWEERLTRQGLCGNAPQPEQPFSLTPSCGETQLPSFLCDLRKGSSPQLSPELSL